MSIRIPITFNSLDTSGVVNGNISHMRHNFRVGYELDKNYSYTIRPVYCRFPNTYQNITTTIGNNTLRYSLNSGVAYSTITLPNGVYQESLMINAIAAGLIANGHFYDATLSGDPNLYQYPFKVGFNQATGKSYFVVYDIAGSTPPYVSANIIIDLTNSGTSTLYNWLGYTLANAVLNTGAAYYESDTDPNMYGYQSQIFFTINGISLIDNISESLFSNTIYISGWGAPNTASEISGDELSGWEASVITSRIDYLELRLVDFQGNLITFPTGSTEANILVRLSLVGREKMRIKEGIRNL